MVILNQWLEYFERQIGFILPENQHHWLIMAIKKTANDHNLNYHQLWNRVQDDRYVRQELLDAVLILESRFFRHQPSIAFIGQQALDWQSEQIKKDTIPTYEKNEFNIWSVGCSKGQEAWSIAMTLADINISHFNILGTDVSNKAIKHANSAIYNDYAMKDIPNKYHHFFKEVDGCLCRKNNKQLKIDQPLQSQVLFLLNNIFLPNSKQSTFPRLLLLNDIIICQNMLIYFRQFDQRDILSRLVERCKVGGFIVLAPGEGCFWKHPHMKKVLSNEINAWKKIK